MSVDKKEASGAMRLQEVEVEKVDEFKYFKSTVQSKGECGKEVKSGHKQVGMGGERCQE